jgi:hypothetical protein
MEKDPGATWTDSFTKVQNPRRWRFTKMVKSVAAKLKFSNNRKFSVFTDCPI